MNKPWWCQPFDGVHTDQSSRSLVGSSLVLWLAHGLGSQYTQVSFFYKLVISPIEISHKSQGSHVYTLGHSALDGESSKEGMGGAMPRWRPHPHPIYESSIVWWRLHSKFGDNHDFDFVSSPLALTHCQFDLGCRFVSFLYKRKAFPPLSGWILVVELLWENCISICFGIVNKDIRLWRSMGFWLWWILHGWGDIVFNPSLSILVFV